MMRRPTILTIEAWLILLYSALKIVVAARYFLNDPGYHTNNAQMVNHFLMVDFVASVFLLISAIGLLRGSNNARWLFIVVQVLYWGFLITTGGFHGVLTVPILISAVLIGILFLPANNQYFESKSKQADEDQ